MLRTIFESVPDSLRPPLYEYYTRARPDRDVVSIDNVDGCYRVENHSTGETLFVPTSSLLPRIQTDSARSRQGLLRDKYTLEGFVEVAQDDIVVDAGSFIGGFGSAVAEQVAIIIFVEPNPHLKQSLKTTLANLEGVAGDVYQAALGDESGSAKMFFGEDPTENSLINLDRGGHATIKEVPIMRLEDLIDKQDLPHIDFLKLDAEGAEPEVVAGFGNNRPEKISIDAGPEREGKPTDAEVVNRLEDMGYETRSVDGMVFAHYRTNRNR